MSKIFAVINKFTGNSAREGRRYATASSTLNIDEINTFDSNRADVGAGGICVDNGNLLMSMGATPL